MRARHAPGGADKAELRSWRYRHPLLDVDSRQVPEHREHPEPVIDDHGLPEEVEIACRDDSAGVRRFDGRARGAEEIGSGMRTARHAVEDTTRSETAVGLARHRPDERFR